VREDKIVELLDPWLCRSFAPHNIETTLQRMVDAQHDELDQHRLATINAKIVECDRKLGRYRAALEAGTDAGLVSQWIAQVQVERALAEQEQRSLTGRRTMTTAEIQLVVDALGGISETCAEPSQKKRSRSTARLGSSSPTSRAVT
jgi:hypothetical protein